MIKPQKDVLKSIETTLLDLLDGVLQMHSNQIHILMEAKTEIQKLRHHIESIAKIDRATSTQMNDLLIKSRAMSDMWTTTKGHQKRFWVDGKDE